MWVFTWSPLTMVPFELAKSSMRKLSPCVIMRQWFLETISSSSWISLSPALPIVISCLSSRKRIPARAPVSTTNSAPAVGIAFITFTPVCIHARLFQGKDDYCRDKAREDYEEHRCDHKADNPRCLLFRLCRLLNRHRLNLPHLHGALLFELVVSRGIVGIQAVPYHGVCLRRLRDVLRLVFLLFQDCALGCPRGRFVASEDRLVITL